MKTVFAFALLVLSVAAFAQTENRPIEPNSEGRLIKPELLPGNPMPEFPKMLGPVTADAGYVSLALELSKEGKVERWGVLKEQPINFGFRDAVEAVIQDWKYRPALWGGNPSKYNVTLAFRFANGSCVLDTTRTPVPKRDVQVDTK